jgi:hypothetical protein
MEWTCLFLILTSMVPSRHFFLFQRSGQLCMFYKGDHQIQTEEGLDQYSMTDKYTCREREKLQSDWFSTDLDYKG